MSDWWSAAPIVGDTSNAAPAAPALEPAHRDLAIRTIYGEAANEPDQGQAAVAAVIKNRMQAGRYGGDSIPGVVLAKNQFEPWWNDSARSRIMALKQDDPRYQKIGGIVDQVFGGQMDDPTGGATHFVAPAAQAALGRSMPSWAQGEGTPIGRHTFFAPEGRVQQASAQGDNWWSGAPIVTGDSLSASGGGKFADTLGENFRTAREGQSPPASPPMGISDKLAALWANPPAGGLVSMVKPIAQGVNTLMQAGHGDIPMTGPDGHTNPAVIDASWDAAKGVPMASAPGGMFAGGPQAAAKTMAALANPVEQAAPKTAPTITALKEAATKGYESPAIKDLAVKPSSVNEFAQATKSALNEAGFDDVVASGTFNILNKLEKAPEGSFVTGQSLDSLRKTLGNAAREVSEGRPTPNANAASRAIDALDNYIPSIAQKDVVAGDPAAAGQAWQTARGNYAAAMQSANIDKKVTQAELRAAASNSGQNVANTIRQRLATVMNDPKQLAGYTPAERAMMEKIVRGTYTGNTLRFAGNLLGGGGGLGMLAAGTAGALATGGPGIVAPAVGYALKSLSNRMTLSQAAKLSEAVRSRAPLAKSMEDFGNKAQAFDTTRGPQTMAAIGIAARNLSNNLRDAGIVMSPGDLLRALQSPVKSAADNNQ